LTRPTPTGLRRQLTVADTVVSWQPRVALLARHSRSSEINNIIIPFYSVVRLQLQRPIKRRRAAERRDIMAAWRRRFNKLHHLQPVDCRCTPGSAQSLRTLDTRV